MPQYFSHDVNAQRDDKCVRLLQELGWKGYGVFWALVERMNETSDCALAYNPKGLAWSLRIQEKFLVRVIQDFGLFELSEDGTTFWSNSAKRRKSLRNPRNRTKTETMEPQPKRKRGRPRKNPLPEEVVTVEEKKEVDVPQIEPETKVDPEKNNEVQIPESETKNESKTETKPAEKTTEKPTETTTKNENAVKTPKTPLSDVSSSTQIIYQPETQNTPKTPQTTLNDANQWNDDFDSENETVVPVEPIITSWNKTFKGTKQTFKGLYLDPIAYQRAKETIDSGYTLDDLKKAFQIARQDNFCWILKDVLKPDNVQRLLIKGEKNNDSKSTYSGGYSTSSANSETFPSDWGDPEIWKQFENPKPTTPTNGNGASGGNLRVV